MIHCVGRGRCRCGRGGGVLRARLRFGAGAWGNGLDCPAGPADGGRADLRQFDSSKRFYVDRGLAVAKSFGSKYVEFATGTSPVKFALYGRRALARTPASLPTAPDRTGS
jgi:hypothetical protein